MTHMVTWFNRLAAEPPRWMRLIMVPAFALLALGLASRRGWFIGLIAAIVYGAIALLTGGRRNSLKRNGFTPNVETINSDHLSPMRASMSEIAPLSLKASRSLPLWTRVQSRFGPVSDRVSVHKEAPRTFSRHHHQLAARDPTRESYSARAAMMRGVFAAVHSANALTGRRSSRPRSVSAYSTCGGTLGSTVRSKRPSRSSTYSVEESIF
jgi:hypothetical protein